MELPKDFQLKMKGLLQSEYDDFIETYNEDRQQGLRVNTLKVEINQFEQISPFTITKIPWVKEGFFYQKEDRPGKHPYHEAGLYYIQEPSAMAVVEIMDPQPGENVLDLCAAPGGKTTHIATRMKQEGFLLTNEIHPARSRILSQNIERMGVTNAVVTNESPDRLADRFPSFFDKILVDAPCSGEGMFRKDPDACSEWSLENVALCSSRQFDILQSASEMLKPGGRLVYSTCTFSPEENEGVISKFLESNSNFAIEEVKVYEGFDQGRKAWISNSKDDIDKTIRIWPHKVQGEGHFIAVLKKNDEDDRRKYKYNKESISSSMLKDYFKFIEETVTTNPNGKFMLFGDQLYIVPEAMLSMKGLKVIRPGLHLGTLKKNRFEPSHALALILRQSDVKQVINLQSDSNEIIAFLRGETISTEGKKGWCLVQVDGFSIGWGKWSNGLLKNHFPKGLRWNVFS